MPAPNSSSPPPLAELDHTWHEPPMAATTSEKTMNAYGVLENCCAERHTFTPKVRDIRAKTPSAAHLIHGDTRDTRGAASRRPQDQGSVCARAHRRSGAACFLSLSHCPLPMQNFVLSESCAHLFFCMRLAEGISWPAAASAGSRSSLEGANLGFGCCCLQATNVASRQQFVAVHRW